MEKIDRELLIKEISSRLPYGIKAQVLAWDEEKGEIEVPLKVYSINTDGYVYFEINGYDVDYVDVEDCLLYLRPMSSMTEEEIEIYRIIIESLLENSVTNNVATLYNFLNSKHLDYNSLIYFGLAIEVTEENNPYKN